MVFEQYFWWELLVKRMDVLCCCLATLVNLEYIQFVLLAGRVRRRAAALSCVLLAVEVVPKKGRTHSMVCHIHMVTDAICEHVQVCTPDFSCGKSSKWEMRLGCCSFLLCDKNNLENKKNNKNECCTSLWLPDSRDLFSACCSAFVVLMSC